MENKNVDKSGLIQSNDENPKSMLATQDTVILEPSTQEIANMPDAQLWTDTQLMTPPRSDSQLMPPPPLIPPRKRRLAPATMLIPMKMKTKCWNRCSFCFTVNENFHKVLNGGLPLPCSITVFNDLAIHQINKNDRMLLNNITRAMLDNCELCGRIAFYDEDAEEKTLFVKIDNNSRMFNVEGTLMNKPTSNAFHAKVAIRIMGIFKKDDAIKPMLRLHQLRVDENGSNKTINNSCIFN